MNMSLEERLYLLQEMKERQEENFAHLQSFPLDCNSHKVHYERSFYKKKNKSHSFSRLLILSLFAFLIIFIGKDTIKDFKPDNIPVYYNILENKLDILSERFNSIVKNGGE